MKVRVTLHIADDARRGIWWRQIGKGRRNRLANRLDVIAEIHKLWAAHCQDLAAEADVNDCNDER